MKSILRFVFRQDQVRFARVSLVAWILLILTGLFPFHISADIAWQFGCDCDNDGWNDVVANGFVKDKEVWTQCFINCETLSPGEGPCNVSADTTSEIGRNIYESLRTQVAKKGGCDSCPAMAPCLPQNCKECFKSALTKRDLWKTMVNERWYERKNQLEAQGIFEGTQKFREDKTMGNISALRDRMLDEWEKLRDHCFTKVKVGIGRITDSKEDFDTRERACAQERANERAE